MHRRKRGRDLAWGRSSPWPSPRYPCELHPRDNLNSLCATYRRQDDSISHPNGVSEKTAEQPFRWWKKTHHQGIDFFDSEIITTCDVS